MVPTVIYLRFAPSLSRKYYLEQLTISIIEMVDDFADKPRSGLLAQMFERLLRGLFALYYVQKTND